MADGPAATPAPPPQDAARALRTATALLPAAATLSLSFEAGGFFAGPTAVAAVALAGALVAWLVLGPTRTRAPSRALWCALGGATVLAAWTLLSWTWSDAPWRAVREADRVLLYLLALALFAWLDLDRRLLRVVVLSIAAAAVVVCAAAAGSVLAPELLDVRYVSSTPGLAYPLTYANALGFVAVVGVLLCSGCACSPAEPRVARVLSAAALPLLATTLALSLSRGALVAAAVGLATVLLLGRRALSRSAVVVLAPPTVVAGVVAFTTDSLYDRGARDAGAVDAGPVPLVLGACCLAAGLLLAVVAARPPRTRSGRSGRRRRAGVAAAVPALLVGGMVAGVPAQVERQLDALEQRPRTFVRGEDPRSHLTDQSANGRLEFWRVALEEFRRAPLHGAGAGTYELSWDRERPNATDVRDAHSLYAEMLGELGVVGVGLVLLTLGSLLVGVVRRAGRSDGMLHATVAGALIAWGVAAGVDWLWEMPAASLPVLALAGGALSCAGGAPDARHRARWPRLVAAVGLCVVVVLAPVRVARSQSHLDEAVAALRRGDCDAARQAAGAADGALPSRPEPTEVLGLCELRQDRPRAAEVHLREALEDDPRSWRLRYHLAVARAAAGRDPRAAARAALERNPREPVTRLAVTLFTRAQGPAGWRAAARVTRTLLPPK
ncbi:MAG TPA: O-antigen ligase family protein [Baekduia sp.]|nr:O-antigen ligase family protein [Baekduia sp.]